MLASELMQQADEDRSADSQLVTPQLYLLL